MWFADATSTRRGFQGEWSRGAGRGTRAKGSPRTPTRPQPLCAANIQPSTNDGPMLLRVPPRLDRWIDSAM